jgi:hypothetical protein
LDAAARCLPHRFSSPSHGEFQRLPCRSPGWPTTCSPGGRSANATDMKPQNVGVAKVQRHDKRRVVMSGRFPGQVGAARQNATIGAGRAARSAQCQNPYPRRLRSAASAICHGNSAGGTSGPPSSGVRQRPPRVPSPIRTGQGSAGKRFEDPRATAKNMTVRPSAVLL